MENYKILGVDEGSSMEEIRQAYENKVSKINEEVKDERRAKAFIKVFDKAFEEIKAEKEEIQNQETIILKDKNYLKEYLENHNIDEKKDFERYKETTSENNKPKKKSSSANITKKKKNSNKKKVSKYRNVDSKKEKNNSKKGKKKEKESSIVNMILKVVLVPIIVVMSILIFLFKLINLISWIASKIIIVAAIAGASIHGYQVYIGQPMYYVIFVACAVAFLTALFLPSISKIVPSILEKINNKLKEFAF